MCVLSQTECCCCHTRHRMSIYATPEQRALEWAYIHAKSALKDHMEAPVLDKRIEPNAKTRKAMQYLRGVETSRLRAELKDARDAWRAWRLSNPPAQCTHPVLNEYPDYRSINQLECVSCRERFTRAPECNGFLDVSQRTVNVIKLPLSEDDVLESVHTSEASRIVGSSPHLDMVTPDMSDADATAARITLLGGGNCLSVCKAEVVESNEAPILHLSVEGSIVLRTSVSNPRGRGARSVRATDAPSLL